MVKNDAMKEKFLMSCDLKRIEFLSFIAPFLFKEYE